MRNKSVYRGILIIAGLLAAAVIIFSHSFTQIGEKEESIKTEKPAEKDQKTVIQAPAEAVTQANVVKIDEQVPDTVLETLTPSENPKSFFPEARKLATKFFKVLFQTVIAPNAP